MDHDSVRWLVNHLSQVNSNLECERSHKALLKTKMQNDVQNDRGLMQNEIGKGEPACYLG